MMTTMPPAGELIDTLPARALDVAPCPVAAAVKAVARVRIGVVVVLEPGARVEREAEMEAEIRRVAVVDEATLVPRRHRRSWTPRWRITLAERVRRPQSPATSKMRLLLRHLQLHLHRPRRKLRLTIST
jgi:hypothetical protein